MGVAAALEMLKSLLWMADEMGSAERASPSAALQGRFTEAEISAAYAFLRRRKLIFAGNTKRPYQLAHDFKAGMQAKLSGDWPESCPACHCPL